ncbi:uncharacterized protein LOC34620759 [Cyclospora cayetanensis]|uniref:Uncharacterized protein LOC34620759 n=1 Tax=Cyclospora cayetanensis TaxID=88456 RepID=A0A6P6RX13_9EIME|nr:uncharacterized protein LOC34620759 [Cyclospora cayetanensis]
MAKDTVWEDSLLGKREDKAVEGHPTSVAVDNPYAFIDEEIRRNRGRPEAPVDATENLELQLEALQEVLRQKIDHSLEAAEASASLLSKAVPEALTSIEDLATDTRACQEAAEQLLSSLEARGASQQESLSAVYVLHAIKKHFEDCSRIVAELHRWHFSLKDSVEEKSTEGFACAVAAFERLGAQEILLKELPASLKALLEKEWRSLWGQTPAGLAEDTEAQDGTTLPHEQAGLLKGVEAFDGPGASRGAPRNEPLQPSARFVAEPEALMAYAERWSSAVEQTAGFIRAAAASVGTARRAFDSAFAAEGDGPWNPKHRGLWLSLLLASMGAGADVPLEALERLLLRHEQPQQRLQQHLLPETAGQDGLELAEQLMEAYEVTATLISATPAFAETEATEPHLWESLPCGELLHYFLHVLFFPPLCPSDPALSSCFDRSMSPFSSAPAPLVVAWPLLVLRMLANSATAAAAETATLSPAKAVCRFQRARACFCLPYFLFCAICSNVLLPVVACSQFCSSVEFLPPSLLSIYGAGISRRLSPAAESHPHATAKRLAPAQALVQMEEEIQAAVSRLLESLVPVCGGGGRAAGAPFIVAAADAALVETLNALSPRINTFHHTVALKLYTCGRYRYYRVDFASDRPVDYGLCFAWYSIASACNLFLYVEWQDGLVVASPRTKSTQRLLKKEQWKSRRGCLGLSARPRLAEESLASSGKSRAFLHQLKG